MNISPLSTKQIESLVLLTEESSELASELISFSLSNPDTITKAENFDKLEHLVKNLPVLKESIDFLASCNFLANQLSGTSLDKKELHGLSDCFLESLRERSVSYNLSELAVEALAVARNLQNLNNIACKCLRHGFYSYHPSDLDKTTNVSSLVSCILALLPRLSDLVSNLEPILVNNSLFTGYDGIQLKYKFFAKKLKYLHYLTDSDL